MHETHDRNRNIALVEHTRQLAERIRNNDAEITMQKQIAIVQHAMPSTECNRAITECVNEHIRDQQHSLLWKYAKL